VGTPAPPDGGGHGGSAVAPGHQVKVSVNSLGVEGLLGKSLPLLGLTPGPCHGQNDRCGPEGATDPDDGIEITIPWVAVLVEDEDARHRLPRLRTDEGGRPRVMKVAAHECFHCGWRQGAPKDAQLRGT
jgi:hypothetical protein